MSKNNFVLVITSFLVIILFSVTGTFLTSCNSSSVEIKPEEEITVKLDTEGPFLILASEKASADYTEAIEEIENLHTNASIENFDTENLTGTEKILKEKKA